MPIGCDSSSKRSTIARTCSERKPLHAAIARALIEHHPQASENEPEIVAQHLTAAGDHAAAAEYWQRAGELAQQRSAHVEAIAHLNAGLTSLSGLARNRSLDAQEVRLRMALARSHTALDGWNSPKVFEAAARARQLSSAIGESAMHGEALFELWTYHCVRGEFGACRVLVEEFVRLAEARSERSLLLMADTVALVTYFCVGEFSAAQRHADRVHALYRPEEDSGLVHKLNHDPEVFASLYDAFRLWVEGRPDAAARASQHAIEIARRLRHPFSSASRSATAAYPSHCAANMTWCSHKSASASSSRESIASPPFASMPR